MTIFPSVLRWRCPATDVDTVTSESGPHLGRQGSKSLRDPIESIDKMSTTGWLTGLRVTADGTGIVSHAGVALADNIGR
jgi:hypothetical protein